MRNQKPKRMKELQDKKRDHELKLIELNNWLMKNHNHPDRNKIWSDKAYHECEINRINKKLYNLSEDLPENGFENALPIISIDSKTTKNII